MHLIPARREAPEGTSTAGASEDGRSAAERAGAAGREFLERVDREAFDHQTPCTEASQTFAVRKKQRKWPVWVWRMGLTVPVSGLLGVTCRFMIGFTPSRLRGRSLRFGGVGGWTGGGGGGCRQHGCEAFPGSVSGLALGTGGASKCRTQKLLGSWSKHFLCKTPALRAYKAYKDSLLGLRGALSGARI